LYRFGLGCLDVDDGMLLPSLVLSAPALLQPVRHLLLLCPALGLPLRWPVIRKQKIEDRK
jgi:hypothetical protein